MAAPLPLPPAALESDVVVVGPVRRSARSRGLPDFAGVVGGPFPQASGDSVSWIECSACGRWHEVSEGAMHAFEAEDKALLCKFEQKRCLKRRRRS